ncbi:MULTISPECIES: hypothetical protein [Streptacidiphilus]|uniref:Uncharacterized protein n=1 Tax=Streptacidiphilus cavernicola TaxID=3342716 RepID=A0ABV6UW24_9ACTN|nr:hypothetical protein [Streptacidiphilus jeojiense]
MDSVDESDELLENYDLARSWLMGAMHGLSDAYRELGSGTGRGFGPMAEYRENNLNTRRPVAEFAQELAVQAAVIAKKAGELDAMTEALQRRQAQDG